MLYTQLNNVVSAVIHIDVSHFSASLLWHLNTLLNFNLPLIILWWCLALGQENESHHSRLPFKSISQSSSKVSKDEGGSTVSFMLKMSLYMYGTINIDWRGLKFEVRNRGIQQIQSLLALAGDVETNPGPGTLLQYQKSCPYTFVLAIIMILGLYAQYCSFPLLGTCPEEGNGCLIKKMFIWWLIYR